MPDLEYKIGGLNIDTKRIHFYEEEPYDAAHLFVVQSLEDSVLIYVTHMGAHNLVAREFALDEEMLVGGGSCYVNGKKELVLDDYSGDYGAILVFAAQRFAEMIRPELDRLGVEVRGVFANPDSRMNSFWKNK
jgi:hypothetical protein